MRGKKGVFVPDVPVGYGRDSPAAFVAALATHADCCVAAGDGAVLCWQLRSRCLRGAACLPDVILLKIIQRRSPNCSQVTAGSPRTATNDSTQQNGVTPPGIPQITG